MDLILRLVLAILGTCILLYLNWLISLLRSHPWALWKMNNHRYFSVTSKPVALLDKFHQKLTYLKIVMIIFAACFAAYQMACWCLGWMPDYWGKQDEYADWVTFRSSLSVIFSIYGGLFFLKESAVELVGELQRTPIKLKLFYAIRLMMLTVLRN